MKSTVISSEANNIMASILPYAASDIFSLCYTYRDCLSSVLAPTSSADDKAEEPSAARKALPIDVAGAAVETRPAHRALLFIEELNMLQQVSGTLHMPTYLGARSWVSILSALGTSYAARLAEGTLMRTGHQFMPENICFDNKGQVLFIDFGAAKGLTDSNIRS
ncbi:hypothetical protein HDU87_008419 [Geranomyces variabilis]|uniref:Protein kinase domain-containing protein n=1 Tax=Geranomyces variabilis TaxID=109894 RepID=A0AAD5XM43_9FUNG|nr:hypothetical protein HDU87_008419 [Geranomyces variabilis]